MRVTPSPAWWPLCFTFGCSGQAELLERWRVEVTFPVWSGERAPRVPSGPSIPPHAHPHLPQREPVSWVTSDPWIPKPGPWALHPPNPTWRSLVIGLLFLGMAHAAGDGGDWTRGNCGLLWVLLNKMSLRVDPGCYPPPTPPLFLLPGAAELWTAGLSRFRVWGMGALA